MSQAQVLNLNAYRAKQLVEDGKFYISEGDLGMALETFQRSINFEENAEALTYKAWVLNLKGETDQAIELCQRALELDPEFGNSLNDLGSYLILKNQLEEAIPFLEKAKTARDYEPRHFPFINLGRIYSAQGRIKEAITEFRAALDLVPDHQEIQRVLEQLELSEKV